MVTILMVKPISHSVISLVFAAGTKPEHKNGQK